MEYGSNIAFESAEVDKDQYGDHSDRKALHYLIEKTLGGKLQELNTLTNDPEYKKCFSDFIVATQKFPLRERVERVKNYAMLFAPFPEVIQLHHIMNALNILPIIPGESESSIEEKLSMLPAFAFDRTERSLAILKTEQYLLNNVINDPKNKGRLIRSNSESPFYYESVYKYIQYISNSLPKLRMEISLIHNDTIPNNLLTFLKSLDNHSAAPFIAEMLLENPLKIFMDHIIQAFHLKPALQKNIEQKKNYLGTLSVLVRSTTGLHICEQAEIESSDIHTHIQQIWLYNIASILDATYIPEFILNIVQLQMYQILGAIESVNVLVFFNKSEFIQTETILNTIVPIPLVMWNLFETVFISQTKQRPNFYIKELAAMEDVAKDMLKRLELFSKINNNQVKIIIEQLSDLTQFIIEQCTHYKKFICKLKSSSKQKTPIATTLSDPDNPTKTPYYDATMD